MFLGNKNFQKIYTALALIYIGWLLTGITLLWSYESRDFLPLLGWTLTSAGGMLAVINANKEAKRQKEGE